MTVPGLYERHVGLAVSIARDYWLPGADSDDVAQEARIGLWVAAREYDPARGVPFAAWASIVIRRRLVGLLRAARAEKQLVLTDAGRDDELEGLTVPGLEATVLVRDELRRALANIDRYTAVERRRRTWRESKRRARARARAA